MCVCVCVRACVLKICTLTRRIQKSILKACSEKGWWKCKLLSLLPVLFHTFGLTTDQILFRPEKKYNLYMPEPFPLIEKLGHLGRKQIKIFLLYKLCLSIRFFSATRRLISIIYIYILLFCKKLHETQG